jgi:hypothetical protein
VWQDVLGQCAIFRVYADISRLGCGCGVCLQICNAFPTDDVTCASIPLSVATRASFQLLHFISSSLCDSVLWLMRHPSITSYTNVHGSSRENSSFPSQCRPLRVFPYCGRSIRPSPTLSQLQHLALCYPDRRLQNLRNEITSVKLRGHETNLGRCPSRTNLELFSE